VGRIGAVWGLLPTKSATGLLPASSQPGIGTNLVLIPSRYRHRANLTTVPVL
jgi:hypothetical protein